MMRTIRPVNVSPHLQRAFFSLHPTRPRMDSSSTLSTFLRHLQTSNSFQRTFPREVLSKKILIWSCIAANGLVFLSWQAARSPASTAERRQKFNRALGDLQRNFTLSARNVREGRWWTLLTSAFSHIGLGHIFVNLFTFHQLGQILVYTPGLKAIRHFGTLIVGSALAGSVAFLSHESSMPSASNMQRVGLGFSGVVSGLVTAAACLQPHQKMLLFGIVPVPLWALGVGYVLYDTYSMDGDTTVAHDAHVGGAVFGGAFYILALRKFGGILAARRLR